MSKDDEKMMLYINVTWVKAFLKLFVTVIIPYNLAILLLYKLSVLSDPRVAFNGFSMFGTFAIAFAWNIIRGRKAANKEK
ncbi:MAG: hypothetical protein FVQ82_00555 [Planctomycetes bacterium]|nr:hypothetical protein [Planctomycetota bacterium]